VLSAITDYSEKRILELGCNMSFLSCFLLKERRAAATMGVDVDATILEAARLVASSLGVEPEYKQLDFDSLGNWEAELAEFKPDIVFALNVLNWVQDKKRFLAFLGCYSEVIIEGHGDVETECNRFRALGFNDIKLISTSERNRPIIHCQK
jgi:2-polyprenyl-3-methyl-5-hydroxy-6-metoxy-1,4-benzoquinol methylase